MKHRKDPALDTVAREKRKAYMKEYRMKDQRQSYMKAYNESTKEKRHEQYLARRDEILARQKIRYAEKHDEISARKRTKNKSDREMYKNMVYDHYGRVCVCCGETEKDFLSIDHINEDGRKARENGSDFCEWIVKNNYPTDLQILCYNCNFARSHFDNNGICPHQSKALKEFLWVQSPRQRCSEDNGYQRESMVKTTSI